MDKEGNILYDIKISDEWTSPYNAEEEERRSWRDVIWQAAWDKLGYGSPVRRLFEPVEQLARLCNGAKLVVSKNFRKLAVVTANGAEIRWQEDAFESVRTRLVFSETLPPARRCVTFSDDETLLLFVDRISIAPDEPYKETKVMLFDADSSSAVCVIALDNQTDDVEFDVLLLSCRANETESDEDYELLVLLSTGTLLSLGCSLTGAIRQHASTALCNAPISAAVLRENTLYVGTVCNLSGAENKSESGPEVYGLCAWDVVERGAPKRLSDSWQGEESGSLLSKLFTKKNTQHDAVRSIAVSPNGRLMLVLYWPSSTLALFELQSEGERRTSSGLVLQRLVPLEALPDRDNEAEEGLLRQLRRLRSRGKKLHTNDLAMVVAADWWDDDSVVLARLNGRLRIYRLCNSALRNRLGSRAECFALAPAVSAAHQNAFYIVDVLLRSTQPATEADGETENDGEKESESESDSEVDIAAPADSLLQRAFGAALRTRRAVKRAYRVYSGLATAAKHARHSAPSSADMSAQLQCSYRLMQLRSSTCEELFERKIALEEYGDALQLAQAYDLDVDRVYEARWEHARPVTCAAIQDYLAKISMRRRDYVLRQCADAKCAPESIDAQEMLLKYALNITDIDALLELEGVQATITPRTRSDSDQFESADESDTDTNTNVDSQAALSKLESVGKLSSAGIRLVRCRRALLHTLDKLHSFEEVLGGRAVAPRTYRPSAFRRFVAQPLVHSAVELARASDVYAIQCLLLRHSECAAARLHILSQLPETLAPDKYVHLLPSFQPDGAAQTLPFKPWRTDDWSELLQIDCDLPQANANVSLSLLTDIEQAFNVSAVRNSQVQVPAIDLASMVQWTLSRAEQVESLTGLVDHALALVQAVVAKGLVHASSDALASLEHDLRMLDTMVYVFRDDVLSLATLRSMDELQRFRRFVTKSLQASCRGAPLDADSCRNALVRYLLPYVARVECLHRHRQTPLIGVQLLRAALLEAEEEQRYPLLSAFFTLLKDYYASRSSASAASSSPVSDNRSNRTETNKRGLLSTLTGGTLSLLKGSAQSPSNVATVSTTRPTNVLGSAEPAAALTKVSELLLIGLDGIYSLQLPADELRCQRLLLTLLSELFTTVRETVEDSQRKALDTRFRVATYDLEIAELLAKRSAARPLSKIRAVVQAQRSVADGSTLEQAVQDVRLFLSDFLRHTLVKLSETRRRLATLPSASVSGVHAADVRTELAALLRDVLALADRIQQDVENEQEARGRERLSQHCVLQLFVAALLGSGDNEYINAARSYMSVKDNKEASRTRSVQLTVDTDTCCELVARACGDYCTAASSVDDELLDCARSCLTIVNGVAAPSLERERRVLKAAELLNDEFTAVLPVRVRLAEAGTEADRLALLHNAVSSSPKAYCKSESLALLGNALRLQPCTTVRVALQHAVRVAKDFNYAYCECERLMALKHAAAWRECAELASVGNSLNAGNRLRLLAFALTHCDETRRLPALMKSVRDAECAFLCDCFSLASLHSTSLDSSRSIAQDTQSGSRALSQLTKLVPVRDIVERLRSPLDAVSRVTSSFIASNKSSASSYTSSLTEELFSSRLPELGLVRPLLNGRVVSPSAFYASLATADESESDCWTCMAFGNCDRHSSSSSSSSAHVYESEEDNQPPASATLYRAALALVLVRAKTLKALVMRQDLLADGNVAHNLSHTPREDEQQSTDCADDTQGALSQCNAHQCFATLLTSNSLELRDLLSVLASLSTRQLDLQAMQTLLDDWIGSCNGADRLLAIVCTAYLYALEYFRRADLINKLTSVPTGTFALCRFIDLAKQHFEQEQCNPDDKVRLVGQALCSQYDALLDLLDARRLDAKQTGVDVDRFLVDSAYRHETVLGLAMTLDNSLLTLAMQLAARHQIDSLQVAVAFVENLFDEPLETERLTQLLNTHALATLRTAPARAAQLLTQSVYAHLDGTNYDRLLLFFDTVAQLSAEAQHSQGQVELQVSGDQHLTLVLQDAERFAAQLRKLKSAFGARDTLLDFKKLLRFGARFDEHVDLRKVLTAQNVHAVASCAAKTTRCNQLYARVMRVYLQSLFHTDLNDAGSFSQRFDMHLQQYAGQLSPADLLDAVDCVLFDLSVVHHVARSLRMQALERTIAYLRKSAAANDDTGAAIALLKRLLAHLTGIERDLRNLEMPELLEQFDATKAQPERLSDFFNRLLDSACTAEDADVSLRCFSRLVEFTNAANSDNDRLDLNSVVTNAVARVLDTMPDYASETSNNRFVDLRYQSNLQNTAVETSLSKLRQLESLCNSNVVLNAALHKLADSPSARVVSLVYCLPFALEFTLDQRRSAIDSIRHTLRSVRFPDSEKVVSLIDLLLHAALQGNAAGHMELNTSLDTWVQQQSAKPAAVCLLFPLSCVPFSNLLPPAIVETLVNKLRSLDPRLGCIAALNTEIEPLHVQLLEYLWQHDCFEPLALDADAQQLVDDSDVFEALLQRSELCVELRKMCSPDVSDDVQQRRRAIRWFRAVFKHLLSRRSLIEQRSLNVNNRDDLNAKRSQEHAQLVGDLAELLQADGFRTEAQTLNKSLRMPDDQRTVDLLMASLKL